MIRVYIDNICRPHPRSFRWNTSRKLHTGIVRPCHRKHPFPRSFRSLPSDQSVLRLYSTAGQSSPPPLAFNPFIICSCVPAQSLARTAAPLYMASTVTKPKPSERDAMITALPCSIRSSTSFRTPKKQTSSVSSVADTISVNFLRYSSVSGIPAMNNCIGRELRA